MWALVSHFFLQYFIARGDAEAHALLLSGLVGFGAIAIGGAGSVIAGTWADHWGRERVASAAMLVSGAIALVIGWLTFLPPAVLIALALVWGFFVVADSAQFSALVTEVTPRHAVGTGLTLQTSLGFGLTALSIWLTVEVSSRVGWGPAFSMLAVGPMLGIWAMAKLWKVRREGATPY